MFAPRPSIKRSPVTRRIAATSVPGFLLLCVFATVHAQNPAFNSGSTGADGAFSPTQSVEVQLPESGVFNFTTVNIPAGVTVSFKRNSKNTPVTILAGGNVTIEGTINVNARGFLDDGFNPAIGVGGPGGFDGGSGGYAFAPTGRPGGGPGGGEPGVGLFPPPYSLYAKGGGGGGFAGSGGYSSVGSAVGALGGPGYGSPSLLPLIGGSGGGGGAMDDAPGVAGGGGAGAILIASSGTIQYRRCD